MVDTEEANVVGQINIGWKILAGMLGIVALFALNHHIRLSLREVSWFGYGELYVTGLPEWLHTPVSTNASTQGLLVGVPMLAFKGQEFVVDYKLSSADQKSDGPRARIHITCFCLADNWHYYRIEGPGSARIVLPVLATGVYSFAALRQSPGPQGQTSSSSFAWGIRAGDADD